MRICPLLWKKILGTSVYENRYQDMCGIIKGKIGKIIKRTEE